MISRGAYRCCPALVIKTVQKVDQFSLDLLVAKRLVPDDIGQKWNGEQLEVKSRRIFHTAVTPNELQWWADDQLNDPAIETLSCATDIVGITGKTIKLSDKVVPLLYEDFKRRDQPRFRSVQVCLSD